MSKRRITPIPLFPALSRSLRSQRKDSYVFAARSSLDHPPRLVSTSRRLNVSTLSHRREYLSPAIVKTQLLRAVSLIANTFREAAPSSSSFRCPRRPRFDPSSGEKIGMKTLLLRRVRNRTLVNGFPRIARPWSFPPTSFGFRRIEFFG